MGLEFALSNRTHRAFNKKMAAAASRSVAHVVRYRGYTPCLCISSACVCRVHVPGTSRCIEHPETRDPTIRQQPLGFIPGQAPSPSQSEMVTAGKSLHVLPGTDRQGVWRLHRPGRKMALSQSLLCVFGSVS